MYHEERNGRHTFTETFKDPRTGKRRRISCTRDKNTAAVRREAQAELDARIAALCSPYGAPEGMTLRALGDSYLRRMRPYWRDSTAERNAGALRSIISILGEDTLVSSISSRYVMDSFLASGKSATTLNEYMTRFKAFWRWAYRAEYVADAGWLVGLDRLPEPSRREKNALKYLEAEELQRLLPELKVDLERQLIEFLALSGLRIGEALALQLEDVDLAARVIRVTKTLNPHDRKIHDGAKTDTSNREVFIQTELMQLCRRIIKDRAVNLLRTGERSDFFFCDFSGEPLEYNRINKYFRENCERVIGRRLSLHSLRHTHASLLFEQGVSLDAVSDRLGHANSRITKEIYLHITKKKRDQFSEQIERTRIL